MYTTDVKINYGELEKYIHWCERNCQNEFHFSVLATAGDNPGEYRFIFENEIDYTTFSVWKS
jgi:hypothetical protein